MKKTNTIFWIVTILFSAFMIFSSVPDVLNTPEAKAFMNGLGYPDYFTHFIGVAKLLGVIAILIPGFYRIKDWAYIGLFYDLFGATYSVIAVGGFQPQVSFMLVPLVLWALSYYYYHKRKKDFITAKAL